MKLGYARVSTIGQDLETQIERLEAAGVQKDQLFIEKVTGTKMAAREQIQALLKHARSGDHIYVTKIDRLARSILDLNKIVSGLMEKGISITFIDHNMTFKANSKDDPFQMLLFNTLGSFAQFERDMIVSRTGEGRKRAMKNGKKMGRKGQPEQNIKQALKLLEAREEKGMTISDISKLTGVPRSTIYAEYKKQRSTT
ncbi:recombinase family protein [Domibacillus sp. PGB-M46]|uniref:recombinase family protein n=1 Tax=Domibacillus sp. PGB-M46 TaxID=2910255 RepID=UPI001F5AADBA|nr:recombinase family protein [Domibacillus sp. PGB-M46]MCI2255534.1 recombinase family protein [Domibacillus sp. PGB-M46]